MQLNMTKPDKKHTKPDVEVRSEEVSDIIERFPAGWSAIVSLIVTVVVLTALALGFVIKYPDTVSGQLYVTGRKAPVRIVANTSGRLHLLIPNNSDVHEGECLGYMENGADYADVMRLDSLCRIPLRPDVKLSLPDSLSLGSLGVMYNDFALAYAKFDQLRDTRIYDNMRSALANQRRSAQKVVDELKEQTALHGTIHATAEQEYHGDSILHAAGVLSDEELHQRRESLLNRKLSGIEYDVAELTKRYEIDGIDIEIAKIDLNVEEEMRNAFNVLVAQSNVLADELEQWKSRYLFITPIGGRLEYLGFWRENIYVANGKEVFSVLPDDNEMIGEMYMSVHGAGKVEEGQDVNVKLADYPYDEYGYVRGRVNAISRLTHNAEGSDGTAKAYLVEIAFPDGMVTNFGKHIAPNYEAIGIGEIITRKRRLIERLFDNLKANTEK